MKTLSFQKEIPVSGAYDVLVCGGGPAGLIAAVAAARNGARTALVERYGFLGGAATAALVNPISTFKKNGKQVIGGLGWELVERLCDMGGADGTYPNGNVPVDAEKLKLAAQRMALESGVTLFLHTTLLDVQGEEKHPTYAILQNKSGIFALQADYMIDCTGDGDLAALCHVPMQQMPPENELQPASLGFRLGGVKTELITGLHPAEPGAKFQMYEVRKVFEALPAEEQVPQFGGPWFCTVLNDAAGLVSVNITRTAANATDGASVTAAECRLREDVHALFALLKKHIPAFKDAYLLTTAPQVGFRESRRIRGVHILAAEEYASAYHFPDSVARGAHPIDIHRAADTKQDVRFLEEAGYIPYRAMIAEGFDNLIVAGRCISADRASFASTRVMATAMALGEAAGTAAALCKAQKCGTTVLDVAILREKLIAQGAII